MLPMEATLPSQPGDTRAVSALGHQASTRPAPQGPLPGRAGLWRPGNWPWWGIAGAEVDSPGGLTRGPGRDGSEHWGSGLAVPSRPRHFNHCLWNILLIGFIQSRARFQRSSLCQTTANILVKFSRFGSCQKFVFAKFSYMEKCYRVTKLQTIYLVSRLIVVVHLINKAECCNSFSSIAAAVNEKQHNASHITGLTICCIDLSCLFYCCLPKRTVKHLSGVCGFWLLSSTNVQWDILLSNVAT